MLPYVSVTSALPSPPRQTSSSTSEETCIHAILPTRMYHVNPELLDGLTCMVVNGSNHAEFSAAQHAYSQTCNASLP